MDKTLAHLSFIKEITNQTISYYHGKDLKISEIVPVGFIQRTYQSVIAVEKLWIYVQDNISFEYSIGLLLRAQLLDALIVADIHRMVSEKKDDETIINYLNKVLSDGFKHTVGYLKLKKANNHITDEQLKQAYESLYKLFEWSLQDYTPSLTPPELKAEISSGAYVTADNLLKELNKSSDYKVMQDLHEYYTLYSKYDHFGLLYFLSMEEDAKKSINRIEFVIFRLLFHCYFCHAILYYLNDSGDQFILSQMKKINDYLEANKEQYLKSTMAEV